MRFENKIAIVAGGAGGIGKGVSKALAKEGAQVVVWDIKQELLDKITEEITNDGGKVDTAIVDILDYDCVAKAVNETAEKYGRLDILVSCVGGGHFKPFIEYTPEFWQKELQYNVGSVFNCFNNALKVMLKQNYGRLLCFMSTTGGTPGLTAYGAAKAGCKAIIENIKAEYVKNGITANAVMPNFTDTPFAMSAFDDTPAGKAALEYTLSLSPLGINKPEYVAKTVLNVLDDDRLTGQIISLL